MSTVTDILNSVLGSHPQRVEALMVQIYEELHRIAAAKMAFEKTGHTLQATALIHEAWLRLSAKGQRSFDNRAHFFASAAESMRRILIDSARRKQRLKRIPPPVEGFGDSVVEDGPSDQMIVINDAIDALAKEDAIAANLVKLRYFTGMTMQEAATVLELPLRTTERLWSYSRAWLRRHLMQTDSLSSSGQ